MNTGKLIFFTCLACFSLTSFVNADSLFGSLGKVSKKVVGKEKAEVKEDMGSLTSLEKRMVDVHSFWEPTFNKDIDHARVAKEAKRLDEEGSVGGGGMFKEAMNHHFLAKSHFKQALDSEEQAQKFEKKAKDAEKKGNKQAAAKNQKTADAYRKDGHIHMDAMHDELMKHDEIADKHDRVHGHGHAFPDPNQMYK